MSFVSPWQRADQCLLYISVLLSPVLFSHSKKKKHLHYSSCTKMCTIVPHISHCTAKTEVGSMKDIQNPTIVTVAYIW